MNDILQILKFVYEEKLPFNKLLGFKIEALSIEQALVRVTMRDELVGNYVQGSLHGGVISAVLDATGGLMASIGVLQRVRDESPEEIQRRMALVGTIDLRVDYLRPGRGSYFLASASVMRTGKKVAVTRMEFHNDSQILIAVGTGTYLVG